MATVREGVDEDWEVEEVEEVEEGKNQRHLFREVLGRRTRSRRPPDPLLKHHPDTAPTSRARKMTTVRTRSL